MVYNFIEVEKYEEENLFINSNVYDDITLYSFSRRKRILNLATLVIKSLLFLSLTS